MTDSDRAPSSRADRPPLPRWLAYRFFGVRVPYHYRFWVRDDVLGRWYLTRQSVCNMTLLALFQATLFMGLPLIDFVRGGKYLYWWPGPGLLLTYVGIVGLAALLDLTFPGLGRRRRRDMLLKHDFHEDGTPIIYAPYPPPVRPWVTSTTAPVLPVPTTNPPGNRVSSSSHAQGVSVVRP